MIERETSNTFHLASEYESAGDQPAAIAELVGGAKGGEKAQILLGAAGTGKTFTISSVIQEVNEPTLAIAHNRTLAEQLYGELKEFFSDNAVEYFVSYYDYYQPETCVPSSDIYIGKDPSINDEVDKLRRSTTSPLLERNDAIVVASVSYIFGLGDPRECSRQVVSLRVGMEMDRSELLKSLVDIQFERNDIDFQRGRFRIRDDVVEIFPASRGERALRAEFFGDEIDRIREIDALTDEVVNEIEHVTIFPATHFVINKEHMEHAISQIQEELEARLKVLRSESKLLEAQRLERRTNYDIEMVREMSYASGIEDYSRHIDGRQEGEPPCTLLDSFPDDFLFVVDEPHATIPQIRGMCNGDRARKQMLVDYGFRLPSTLDNRPLCLEEFEQYVNQIVYVSAASGPYEMKQTETVVQQVIRPTGLLDPEIGTHPIMGQIDDLVGGIHERIERDQRVFATALAKKTTEDLTDYFKELDLKAKYLHSDIKTLERTEVVRDLQLGEFGILIGINLLREGIDTPEVSLITILDADKEGFLRSGCSLMQTMGRVVRNTEEEVIMYVDKIIDSMRRAMDETAQRRAIQEAYNEEHGIEPKTIIKEIRDLTSISKTVDKDGIVVQLSKSYEDLSGQEKAGLLMRLEREMKDTTKALDFKTTTTLRDAILELKAAK